MIYVTGDTHAMPFNQVLERVSSSLGNKALTEEDTLLIAGDFGYLWFPEGHQNYDALEDNLNLMEKQPFTILFIDGNHENFDRLDALPLEKKYQGVVGMVRNNVFHLRRGECYVIEDNKILTIGGGISVDKRYRREGSSWWPRENISCEETEKTMKAVYDNKQIFDYVITHTGPRSVIDKFFKSLPGDVSRRMSYPGADRMYDPTAAFLEELYTKHIKKFKGWFFAHLHMNSHLQTVGLYGKKKNPLRIVSIRDCVLPITFFEKQSDRESTQHV